MLHFWKSYGTCLIWLFLSEILCLILSFSFAILSGGWIRWLSLLCGMLAHVLLMMSCAQKIAQQDIAVYRQTRQRASLAKPLLLALGTAIPLWMLYGMLWIYRDSVLVLNLFSLLNAPYLQLHRLLIGGAEPFSAIPLARRLWMAAPPLLTATAWYWGYRYKYNRQVAEIDARQPNTSRT